MKNIYISPVLEWESVEAKDIMCGSEEMNSEDIEFGEGNFS